MELVSRLYTLEQRVWTDVRLKAECVSRGMIDQLLDHCRDPETENSLRSASVACLAALAHGQATVRDEIVRKGAVSVLTGFGEFSLHGRAARFTLMLSREVQ